MHTVRVYIRYGPGYYTLSVTLLTSHGIIYEDYLGVGYNLGFMDGFGTMLWLPLLVACAGIVFFGNTAGLDEDDPDNPRENVPKGGILGGTLPT